MTPQDAATTTKEPRWQTDWTSEYISKGKFDVYGLKTRVGELVALGAYEISEDVVTVHMESQAQKRPVAADFSRWTFRSRLRNLPFSTTRKSDFQVRAIFSADRTYFAPL